MGGCEGRIDLTIQSFIILEIQIKRMEEEVVIDYIKESKLSVKSSVEKMQTMEIMEKILSKLQAKD